MPTPPITEPAPAAQEEKYDDIPEADYTQITSRLRQYVSYPYRARQQGWQGKVLLTVIFKADGDVANIKVTTSSGHALLDDSAITTVRKAAPFHALGRDVRLLLPVTYKLR